MTTTKTNSALYLNTVDSLLYQKWSEARKNLDDLARSGNKKQLVIGGRIANAKTLGVPEAYQAIIQDRIDLVNANAFNNNSLED